MKVDKLSISIDPELGDAVREAAGRSGMAVSAWLADAARRKLREQALTEFLAEWQAEHGDLTAEEIARAESELGIKAGEATA